MCLRPYWTFSHGFGDGGIFCITSYYNIHFLVKNMKCLEMDTWKWYSKLMLFLI